MSVAYANISGVPRLGSGVPLVARVDELDQLRSALDRAREGTAGAVLVSGDAGVGKSRLLSEFTDRARAAGTTVLVGHCVGVGDAGLPYLPFTEVVEQLRAEHADTLAVRPALADVSGRSLPSAPGADGGDQRLAQLQFFDAILGALTDLGTDHTVVLALEDLHWADPSSRDLVSFLLSRLSSQRVLVVATYRSDDLHRQHPLRPLLAELVRLPTVERLDLQPFAPADTTAFVNALVEDGIDDNLIAAVVDRSEGNAFFAEELVAAVTIGDSGLPATLTEVLLARVEQLSPATQRVIRAVSVTGRRHVRHATVGTVLGMADDELEAALREAVQHHVLVSSDLAHDAYTFRHALLREAVYADLLPGERVRLHSAYAALAAEKDHPTYAESLAYHSLHSNDLPGALAASVQAAEYAMQVRALGAELRHVEQALELWDAVADPDEVAGVDELALHRKAAYVATAAGHPDRGLAYGRAALRLADESDDPVLRADVRRQVSDVLLTNGRWQEANDVAEEAWELIQHQPASKERAWVLAMMARRQIEKGAGELQSFGEAAIADAEASGSAGAEADALITLAFGEMRADRPDQAAKLLKKAIERAADAAAYDVELRARFNLSTNHYDLGQLDRAASTTDEGVRRASDLGLGWSRFGRALRWMQAMAHYARGAWDCAVEATRPAGTEQVSDTASALIVASGGLVQTGLGAFDQAEQMLARVRPEWARDDQIAQLAAVAGAEMACWQGKPDAAAELIDEALDAIRKFSGNQWQLGGIRMATLALSAQADRAHRSRLGRDSRREAEAVAKGEQYAEFAEQTAEHGIPRTAKLGPEGLAWLTRMRAERQRLHGADAPEHWREVIEAFGYGEIYPQAIARWRLADALVTRGDREAAADELTAAVESAEKLGARPLRDACRDLARRARLGLPGAAPPVTDTLTPREVSVLRLVADGRTNRQIGDELFISEKTVSVHVSRVMSKLGAASRTEAVAVAFQRGLLES
jgi:DNA-binding CsgD family transcriptional regulator